MITQDIQYFSDQLKRLGIRHEIIEHEEFSDYRNFLSGISATLADCCPILIMVADGSQVALIKRGDCKLYSSANINSYNTTKLCLENIRPPKPHISFGVYTII